MKTILTILLFINISILYAQQDMIKEWEITGNNLYYNGNGLFLDVVETDDKGLDILAVTDNSKKHLLYYNPSATMVIEQITRLKLIEDILYIFDYKEGITGWNIKSKTQIYKSKHNETCYRRSYKGIHNFICYQEENKNRVMDVGDGFILLKSYAWEIKILKYSYNGELLWKTKTFKKKEYDIYNKHDDMTFLNFSNDIYDIQTSFGFNFKLNKRGKKISYGENEYPYYHFITNKAARTKTLEKKFRNKWSIPIPFNTSSPSYYNNKKDETYILFYNTNTVTKIDENGKKIFSVRIDFTPQATRFIECDNGKSFIAYNSVRAVKYSTINNVVNVKVNNIVEKWKRKGKYEKNTDYINRVNESTITEKVEYTYKRVLKSYTNDILLDKVAKLGDYNPENDFFNISFGNLGNGKIYISNNIAEDFELNFNKNEYKNPKFKLSENGIHLVSVDIFNTFLNKTFKYLTK